MAEGSSERRKLKRQKVQKKGEPVKKRRLYDIENFTVSYSKNETFIRNISTEYNRTVNYRGALTYNYNNLHDACM